MPFETYIFPITIPYSVHTLKKDKTFKAISDYQHKTIEARVYQRALSSFSE
jgi:hypothetical protein